MVPSLKKPNVPFFILLLVPFIKPVGLDYYTWTDPVFTVWKLLVLAYLFLALLPKCFCAKPKKKPFGLLGLVVFWIIYLAGCLRTGTDVVSIATAGISSLLMFSLISYELRIGNGMLMLRSLAWLFTGLILAQVLSVILVKAGILWLGYGDNSPIYLFGMDNYSAFFMYPMAFIVLFYQQLRYGKFGVCGWGLLLLIVSVYLYTSSLTAAGAGILVLFLCALQKGWQKLPKLKGVFGVAIAMAVLLVLICRFQIQNLLASFLTAVSKGITLNSRTIIWDQALDLISQRPFFGYGSLTAEQIANYALYGTTHAHNLFMELLLRTGIVGTAAYLLFLFGFVKPGRQYSSFSSQDCVLLIGLLGQMVLSFMDFYPVITIFYLYMSVVYFRKDFMDNAHRQEHKRLTASEEQQ